MLWGSHDLDLNQEHAHYLDNAVSVAGQTKYERLCRIKAKVDPNGVFTPNKFCVQAPPVTAVINESKMAASLRSRRKQHGA